MNEGFSNADLAIYAIQNYIFKLRFPLNSNMRRVKFRDVSYSIWAAYEIISRINAEKFRKREAKSILEILDEFIFQMDEFLSKRLEQAFDIAIRTANEIKIILNRKMLL